MAVPSISIPTHYERASRVADLITHRRACSLTGIPDFQVWRPSTIDGKIFHPVWDLHGMQEGMAECRSALRSEPSTTFLTRIIKLTSVRRHHGCPGTH